VEQMAAVFPYATLFRSDGTGLWVLTKRLEKGTFSWPKHIEPEQTRLALSPQALAMLTDGVDLRGGKLTPSVNIARACGLNASLRSEEHTSELQSRENLV